MKTIKKWVPVSIIVALAAMGGMLAMVDANAANTVDVEAASNRLRNALEKVQPTQNPNIADERRQPSIPNLKGIKQQVPDVRNYGHQENVDVDPINIAKRYNNKVKADTGAAKDGDLLVFVSFSMPEASLKRIALETAKVGGTMVIRGFKDDSLKETIRASQDIAALKGNLLIHPDLFDHYQITEVPVTVLARSSDDSNTNCSGNSEEGLCTEHLKVAGDVSLHSALDYFIHQNADDKLTKIAQANQAKLEGAK